MSKRYRLILMILSIIALLAIGWQIKQDFSFLFNEFWFTAGLLLLILLSLIDQPHFSKDSNVFVNGITAEMSLLLVPKNQHDPIFWSFFGITGYLVVSSYILMWIRSNELREESKIVQFFSRINRILGRPETIFSAFFLWGGIKQYTLNSNEFNALLWFWIVFTILNFPVLAKNIESLFRKSSHGSSPDLLGRIFSVQSKNIFLIKMFDGVDLSVNKFDLVQFKYSVEDKRRAGIVLDNYWLNQEQWLKVFSSNDIESENESQEKDLKPDMVYKSEGKLNDKYVYSFIGVVSENSIIGKIKFIYNSLRDIYEGRLVEVSIGEHRVLYQVVQGTTKVEQLENKNDSGYIEGEAIQLGEWNEERQQFEQYGWVPSINTPVFIASNINDISIENDYYKIGVIPDTNYPVLINKELAVTHHTAILGVTGSGKSVFARNLISQIASEDTKVIIVDLTGEYKTRYESIKNVISDIDSKNAFDAIEELATLNAKKYPTDADKKSIKACEEKIKKAFYYPLKDFLEGTERKSIFEISEIANKADILEYTRWFFWVLFNTAKTKHCFGKRVCVVLEEAHTIVPELNSMGVSDYASKATVNSIAQIALQGRKYDIGFIVIAQRTANVSKTVLTQCNSIIVFQELDKTTNDFLSNYLGIDYIKALPTLKFRRAIAIGKAFKSTVPMIFEVPEIQELDYPTSELKNEEQKVSAEDKEDVIKND